MKSQMTIGKRISCLSGLLVLFTVTVGVLALVSMARMEAAAQSMIGDSMPGIYSIGRAESVAKDIRGEMLTYVGSDKQEDMVQLESAIAQSQQELRRILEDYEKTITKDRDRELYSKIAPALDRFLAAWETPRALSRRQATGGAGGVSLGNSCGIRRFPEGGER